jgi:CHAD domain-containing protein
VSSTSQFDVLLSETARNYLLSLPEKDARAVAVYLLTFYKNGTPENSRTLTVLEDEKNDRIWIVGSYEFLYRFLPEDRRVEVGIIRRTQPPK